MGQNPTSQKKQTYQSRDFFQQQVQLYRWRADPTHNSHICRVTFHLQQSIKDKEKLKSFLEHEFTSRNYISLGDILKLANQNSNEPQEELMTFQNYICTLADIEEKLNLAQTLYVIHSLFSGYETILNKVNKFKTKLNYCFVTREGEVRAWYNPDFKINEVTQDINENQANNPLITTQIGMIKRILEFGQKLVSIHTEFLHFTRMFKSYMERDILQNWTFSNARKLVNSYVYTYRLTLPQNLKELISKVQRSTFNTSFSEFNTSLAQSQTSYVQSSCLSNKSEYLETGPSFNKKMISTPSSGRKDHIQRPISYSDFSSKKSQELVPNPIKTHCKKYASTDLKNFNDRKKKADSPKMIRSDMLSQHSSKSEPRKKRQTDANQQNPYHKVRNQRGNAFIDDESSQTNMNSTAPFTPNSYFNKDFASLEENNSSFFDKFKTKPATQSGIMKQNQCHKQKKKLEKKAAVVSKYISFCQQTKPLDKNDTSAPQLTGISGVIVEQLSDEKSNHHSTHQKTSHHSKKENINDEKISMRRQSSVQAQLGHYNHSPMMSRKGSFENTPKNNKNIQNYIRPFKGQKTDYFRHFQEQQSCESSQVSNHGNSMTVKTVNRLVDNNEVSIHESVGSFMSVEQSQNSQYHGALSNMGRSVDVAFSSRGQQFQLQKKPFTMTMNAFNSKNLNNR